MIDISGIVIERGKHEMRVHGMCAMELVSYIAGEPHSDHPRCACPVLTSYLIRLNDGMGDVDRQRLKPFIPRLIGTRDEHEVERARVLAWSAVTKFAPAALRACGMEEHAVKLEALERHDLADAAASAAYASAYASVASKAPKAAYDAAAYAAYAVTAVTAVTAAYAATYAAADAAAYAAAYAAEAAHAAPEANVFDLALAALEEALMVGKASDDV